MDRSSLTPQGLEGPIYGCYEIHRYRSTSRSLNANAPPPHCEMLPAIMDSMKLFWCAALAAGALSAQTFSGAAALDRVIDEAVEQGRMPGAVLLVGHEGKVVYRKAYGKRALVPLPEAMTLDTVFDCASLTKVVATTSSLMKLFEEGRFRLGDKITDYIPEFQGGKSEITLRQLFTHFSGLQPDVPLSTPWTGYDTGIKLACTFKAGGPPATRYVYSDINFILLGELVHRLSGKMLSAYARENIFLPIGMKESMFQPPGTLVPRIAPTERWPVKTGPPLRGVVHYPTARSGGPVFTGQRSVGAMRGTSEAGGWNMLSFMPMGRKIFSRAYAESILPLRRCTSSPSRMKLMSLYT